MQVLSNWFCTQLFDTSHGYTEDRPDAQKKSLWNEDTKEAR